MRVVSAVLSGYACPASFAEDSALQHLRFVINSSFTYFHAHFVRYPAERRPAHARLSFRAKSRNLSTLVERSSRLNS